MGIKIENRNIVFEENQKISLPEPSENRTQKVEDSSLVDYIGLLASKLPAPGGGAASALCGAQGFALGSMVCNFTIGKAKFAQYEDRVKHIHQECLLEAKRMLDLMDLDEENFIPLSKAYGIKAETEEEKASKQKIMDEALGIACLAPLEMIRNAHYGLTLLDELKDISSLMVVSDIGVAAENFRATIDGAKLNVMINAKSLKDLELQKSMNEYIDEKSTVSMDIYKKVMEFVYSKL